MADERNWSVYLSVAGERKWSLYLRFRLSQPKPMLLDVFKFPKTYSSITPSGTRDYSLLRRRPLRSYTHHLPAASLVYASWSSL